MFGCFLGTFILGCDESLRGLCVSVSRVFVEYVLGLKLGVNTWFFGVNGVNTFFGWSI